MARSLFLQLLFMIISSFCFSQTLSHITLLRGENFIKSYRFGSGKAEHMFCTECGVKAFYQPRSHPNKYSINFRCVKKGTLEIENTIEFDGKNWEKNINSLKSKV